MLLFTQCSLHRRRVRHWHSYFQLTHIEFCNPRMTIMKAFCVARNESITLMSHLIRQTYYYKFYFLFLLLVVCNLFLLDLEQVSLSI